MDRPVHRYNRQSSWSDDSILQDFGELDSPRPLSQEVDFPQSADGFYASDQDSLCRVDDITDPQPTKRKRKRRARLPAKTLTLRCKPQRKPSPPLESIETLESLVEDMFAFPEPNSPLCTAPSEVDSLASTARTALDSRSRAESPQPYEQVFTTLCESSEGLQSIVTCLQHGNADVCSIAEKKKIVTGLKDKLQEIEGNVEALKESLKKLIKYTL